MYISVIIVVRFFTLDFIRYLKEIPILFLKSIFLYSSNFPELEKLDIESQISEFKWVIHNGLRRTSLIYRSDKQQDTISQHRWNGYQWSFLTNIELKKEEYKNLLEHLPTLLSYIEMLKKTCIDIDEGTQS